MSFGDLFLDLRRSKDIDGEKLVCGLFRDDTTVEASVYASTVCRNWNLPLNDLTAHILQA